MAKHDEVVPVAPTVAELGAAIALLAASQASLAESMRALASAPRGLSLADVEAHQMKLLATPHDEIMRKDLDKQRGRDRPPPPEFLVPCKSPLTGATFTARCVVSRTYPEGSVVEMLDYAYPDGIEVPKARGGLYPYPEDSMYEDPAKGHPPGTKSGKFNVWLHANFYQSDARSMLPGGEHLRVPTSGLVNWRTDIDRVSVEKDSIVVTPAQLAAIGITPDQLREAIAQAPAVHPTPKAAE